MRCTKFVICSLQYPSPPIYLGGFIGKKKKLTEVFKDAVLYNTKAGALTALKHNSNSLNMKIIEVEVCLK